jgi:uncharacterized protein
MLRQHSNGCTLATRAQPGAKKTAITGIYGEGDQATLKIAVHAPPIEGRANEALIEFLAAVFALPKSSIQLLSGAGSRSKVFLLKGLPATTARTALDKAIESGNHFSCTA